MTRDPFKIVEGGQVAAQFNAQLGLSAALTPIEALGALELDAPSDQGSHEALTLELRAAERSFCWGTHGVGVFSGTSGAETQFWTFMLQKFADTLQTEGQGAVAHLNVPQAFNPDLLMPSEDERSIQEMRAAGFAFRTGASDLAKAVESVVSQTRIDETEPVTFIVTMPDIPDHIAPLMRFDAARAAGNETAARLQIASAQEQRDYFATDTEAGSRHVRNLERRLKVFLDEIISEEAPERVPNRLRQTGEQISPLLAQGLEYLYYRRLLAFVDAGSGYRIVPKNVRIGLVVDATVYDAMLLRGLSYPYATVKTWDSEAALGCYATIPRNRENHGVAVGNKIATLRHGMWQEDPVTPAMTAALIFAEAELPRLPAEDIS